MVYNVLHILEATQNMDQSLTAQQAFEVVLAGLDDAELRQVRDGLLDMVVTVENRLQVRENFRQRHRR